MAIAFDATAGSNYNNTGTTDKTLTWSHTCSGANRVLVVGVSQRNDANTMSVSGVTYNSVAMTQIGTLDNPGQAGSKTYLFGLIGPSTGANNVVVTWTGALTANQLYGACTSVSFTGADQTTGWHNYNSASGSSTSPSVTITSAADEIVIDCLNAATGGDGDATAGQTQRQQQWATVANSGLQADRRCIGGTETAGGGASVAMGWTLSTSRAWATGGASIMPASAVAASGPMLLTGVGT